MLIFPPPKRFNQNGLNFCDVRVIEELNVALSQPSRYYPKNIIICWNFVAHARHLIALVEISSPQFMQTLAMSQDSPNFAIFYSDMYNGARIYESLGSLWAFMVATINPAQKL
jgi:hypothetical protein